MGNTSQLSSYASGLANLAMNVLVLTIDVAVVRAHFQLTKIINSKTILGDFIHDFGQLGQYECFFKPKWH